MHLRPSDRKLSFNALATTDAEREAREVLIRFPSDPATSGISYDAGANHHSPKKRKKKKKTKKPVSGKDSVVVSGINRVADPDGNATDSCSPTDGVSVNNYSYSILEPAPTIVVPEVLELGGGDYSIRTVARSPHLRQRSVNVNGVSESDGFPSSVTPVGNVECKSSNDGGEIAEKESERENEVDSKLQRTFEMNGRTLEEEESPKLQRPFEMTGRTLEKEESLDWKKLMAEDPSFAYHVEKSPIKYFLEEMHAGNSLRRTVNLGNEKERERVYNTIFQLPWRIELLIDVGFFVCLDSFLSLFTIMPARILMMLWRLLKTSSRDLQQLNYLILVVSSF